GVRASHLAPRHARHPLAPPRHHATRALLGPRPFPTRGLGVSLTEPRRVPRAGLGGFPPWTTLSRIPRGHSSPPRDVGLSLRRFSPEDTGPGREATQPRPPR